MDCDSPRILYLYVLYVQHCDSVITKEIGVDWKLSAVIAQLTSDEVSLSVADGRGWNIIFDIEPAKVGSWIYAYRCGYE